ncbi:hypothetical protein ONA91_11210 [Micromonospora sp. DR5-3]|uniref:hypothetical protein n=1 Tax=unclassified Micromonospora TaxID=2617518 RepID=UPI0011D502D7|nr:MULTISPECIES: hypothetical protein [unclassified Micromonospora]MCW3815025.1 hypothetical protein [Micromonospora sp. DR5-3]TYC25343.1 hypothetical protein FXF52_05965 [Micromonospora sp. MP36]
MKQTVLHHFLTEIPAAAAIWSALLVLAMAVLAALVARPERDTPPDPVPDPAAEEAARRADLRRYAEEVAVAAAGAAQTARRWREQWLTAHDELDRAWRAYDEAEAAARRLAGATVLRAPRTPRTPAEYAARERWLHHAAMTAHWRGDLTARQLADVLAGRNGWDPRRHPAEQEIVLARAVREGRRAHWRAVAERERRAWRDAELAAEAARVLAVEAYAAAEAVRPEAVPVRPAEAVTQTLAPVAAGAAGVPAARWRPARVG